MTKQDKTKEKLTTKETITWCPGCPNFMILESVKKAISELTEENPEKFSPENFAMATGIGCHAKIFDYININGIYGLHGRTIPTAQGIKLGNPKLNVLGFAGDGDTYAEGISHFLSAFRHNIDITLIVHNNQSFSLTKGQPTPTSQEGYISKASPTGNKEKPINPIAIALASGATFIARCNPLNIADTKEILKKAVKHKGFAFVEMMQKCLIFNTDMNSLERLMYNISDCHNLERAEKLANEWDYNTARTGKDRIPVGIIYEEENK